jgi:peroxiredoxin
MALTFTPQNEIGKDLPTFQGLSIHGNTFSSASLPKGQPVLVLFICNHCPYVKAIENRLVQLGHDLKQQGIPMIAICSNDPEEYPEDNFEALKANAQEKNFVFEYLHDADQSLAHLFGAVCTPDFFLYDKNHKLAYRGRLDDNWKNEKKVTRRELFEAALELKAGKAISRPSIPSMGCSIKWSHK